MKADLNLFDSYRLNNKHAVSKSSALYTIIALIIMVIVLIAVTTGVLVAFNLSDSQKISQLKIENMELKRDTAKVESVQAELNKINEKNKAYDAVDNDIKVARMMTKQEINSVYSSLATGVSVKGNIYSNSVMTMLCISKDIHDAAKSAEALHKQGITAIVQYNGFAVKEGKAGEGEAAPQEVEFTLMCYIASEEAGDVV